MGEELPRIFNVVFVLHRSHSYFKIDYEIIPNNVY
jgi:hypothetical protein